MKTEDVITFVGREKNGMYYLLHGKQHRPYVENFDCKKAYILKVTVLLGHGHKVLY